MRRPHLEPGGWRARLEALTRWLWWRPRLPLVGWPLAPLSLLYGALAALHRLTARTERLPAPVLVVGNWVAGGAGKTPTTLLLLRTLAAQGHRPGVISRGYGRTATLVMGASASSSAADVGDEPLLIHRRTGVPVWVGASRVAAGRALLAAHPEVSVLVCDDGLQNARLARDVQVVVVDERGLGNGWLLPAGPLRERPPRTVPPRTVLAYNAATPTTALPGVVLPRALGDAWPLAAWWAGDAAARRPLADLAAAAAHHRVAAAGIASPERFFAMLAASGIIAQPLPLPDHAPWRSAPWPTGTHEAFITEKDAAKLPPTSAVATSGAAIWVVPLDLGPCPPELAAALRQWLPAPTASAVLTAAINAPPVTSGHPPP